MKKTLKARILGATMATAIAVVAQQASAGHITQVVTSGGNTGTIDIVGNAVLQSATADGVTYNEFTPVGVNDPSAPELLWANTLSNPGSASAAIGDGDLATGALNNGTDSVYDLSAGVNASTMLYFFGNGNGGVNVDGGTGDATGSGGTTPPADFVFKNSSGTNVGTLDSAPFFFQDSPTNTVRAPNLLSFDFTRGNGNALNNRTISGMILPMANIVFESGFGFGDVAGFVITSGGTDVQDVGYAAVSVPEPASLVMLGLASLSTLACRKRTA